MDEVKIAFCKVTDSSWLKKPMTCSTIDKVTNRLGIWSGHENFFHNLDTILEQILDNRPSMVDISDLVTLPYPVRVSKILNFLSRD